MQQITPFVV